MNFGNRNAIHLLATMINALYAIKVPEEKNSKTTYNVGLISGGTSVNTIAQEAEMFYEYRSDNKNCLEAMETSFTGIIETFRAEGIEVVVEKLGDRPCSAEIDPIRFGILQKRVRDSVKTVLGCDAFTASGSTDCNIPLSIGIPAVCFGVCRGKGAHTREESVGKASLYDGCRLLLDFLYRN